VHYRSSDKNDKLITSNVKKMSLMRVGCECEIHKHPHFYEDK